MIPAIDENLAYDVIWDVVAYSRIEMEDGDYDTVTKDIVKALKEAAHE